MLWFRKKEIAAVEKATEKSTVEVNVHKKATKKEIDMVNMASTKLNKAFERNHFTVKMYLANGNQTKMKAH